MIQGDELARLVIEMEGGPIGSSIERGILARRLPKAELHCHLSGAIRPSFSRVPRGERVDSAHDYVDGETFFTTSLPAFARSHGTAAHLIESTLRVLEGAIDHGCRHVELTLQPYEFAGGPLTFDEILDAVTVGYETVTGRSGLSGGIIVSTSRDHDADAGVRTVEDALRARDRGVPVLGIGNDGGLTNPLSEYRRAYALARAEGLRTTCHIDIPDDVHPALDLGLDRIDHAYDLRDEDIARVRDAGIPMTMSVFGNMSAIPGRFPNAAAHPFDRFRRAGLQVSLHTDDPALYFNDIMIEYVHAAQEYEWDARTMADVALTSLESAWIAEDRREALLTRWRAEADALVSNPRNPGSILADAHV